MTNIRLHRNIKYIPELFDEMVGKSKEEKISLLQQFVNRDTPMSKVLFEVVRFTYRPDLVIDLPEGMPPVRDANLADYSHAPLNLYVLFKRRVPYFCNKFERYIQDDLRRERLFIQTVEGLYKRDLSLFIQIKDKKLTEWDGINEALFRAAFPSWFTWDETPVEAQIDPATDTDAVPADVDNETPSIVVEETQEAPAQEEIQLAVEEEAPAPESKPKRRGRPKKSETSSGDTNADS